MSWGIAEERLLLEERSRNTRENARYTAEVAQGRGWSRLLLVTSAYHMQRSQECFAAAGLAVHTLPVDWRTSAADPLHGFAPRARALEVSTASLREWVGRWVYRLTAR